MVLILSFEADYSTVRVIDWLEYFNVPWIRINGEDIDSTDSQMFFNLDNNNNSEKIIIDNKEINLKEITVVWMRRIHRWDKQRLAIKNLNNFDNYESCKLHDFSKSEIFSAYSYLINSIHRVGCKWLDHPSSMQVNKLVVLKTAKSVGLKIPETIVTNSKSRLRVFVEKFKDVITKPIGETQTFVLEQQMFALFTSSVTIESLKRLPDYFYTSLFQEKISKKYELRIFFIDGIFFSMAIFSQDDEKTSTDFRNYNEGNWNRMVPYEISSILKDRIKNLMGKLRLRSGSIDLVVDASGDEIFLEVNPVGQFGMLSSICNFPVEKAIANCLRSDHNKSYIENEGK